MAYLDWNDYSSSWLSTYFTQSHILSVYMAVYNYVDKGSYIWKCRFCTAITLPSLIVFPDKVRDTLDSARSRRRRTDFLCRAITQKLFILGLSNLVCGFIWGRTPCLLFCSLGLPEIGQWRPLKGPNLGVWVYFGPVFHYKKADGLGYHIYDAYICPL